MQHKNYPWERFTHRIGLKPIDSALNLDTLLTLSALPHESLRRNRPRICEPAVEDIPQTTRLGQKIVLCDQIETQLLFQLPCDEGPLTCPVFPTWTIMWYAVLSSVRDSPFSPSPSFSGISASSASDFEAEGTISPPLVLDWWQD